MCFRNFYSKDRTVVYMNSITIEAVIKNIPQLTDTIDEFLESLDCPLKIQMQIDVAMDEIVTNVAMYAYGDSTGPVTMEYDKIENKNGIVLVFKDNGMPFNPLTHEDPDTSLSAEARKIGGLGIFMVKNSMDELSYEYTDNTNIFTVKKYF